MSNNYTSFDGEIRIKLVRKEMLASIRAAEANRKRPIRQDREFRLSDYRTLDFRVDVRDRETDEGILKIQQASALLPQGEYLFGSMADEINLVIRLCPEHNYSGEITAVGRDNKYAVKAVVKAGAAADIPGKVVIRFEDGTEESAQDF
jgi:hypothetical protein